MRPVAFMFALFGVVAGETLSASTSVLNKQPLHPAKKWEIAQQAPGEDLWLGYYSNAGAHT